MTIDDAEQLARDELTRSVDRGDLADPPTGAPLRAAAPPGADEPPAPILPYFPVLLLGRDSWTAAHALPSVGYARFIYLAITINWVIDLLGLALLFHSYMAQWDDPRIAVGVPLLLATLMSSGFAAFAIGLVQKPLRPARPPALTLPLKLSLGALATLLLGVIVAGQVFVDRAPWFEFAVLFSEAALTASAVVLLATAFGVMDTIYVLARGAVMVTVGYLVATPLHEGMFAHEIEGSFYARHQSRLRQELAALDEQASGEVATYGQDCMVAAGFADDLECTQLKRALDEARVMTQAYEFVARAEENGRQDEPMRRVLQAKQAEFPDLAAVLSIPPPKAPRRGTKYYEHLARQQEFATRARSLEQRHTKCVDSVASCARQKQPEARTETERQRLTDELRRFREGKVKLGAIDRGLELEHLIEAREADAAGARAVVWAKLRAAWILALMMPLIVLIMKLTAGARLERFLDRRWKAS